MSGRNVKIIEGYVLVNVEVASSSNFRDIKKSWRRRTSTIALSENALAFRLTSRPATLCSPTMRSDCHGCLPDQASQQLSAPTIEVTETDWQTAYGRLSRHITFGVNQTESAGRTYRQGDNSTNNILSILLALTRVLPRQRDFWSVKRPVVKDLGLSYLLPLVGLW